MLGFSLVCVVFGSLGLLTCIMFAWGFRDDKGLLKKFVIGGIICLALLIIGVFLLLPELPSGGTSSSSSSSSSDSNSKRCPICEKKYSDRENVKSINHTNMCSKCNKNYKYAAEYVYGS